MSEKETETSVSHAKPTIQSKLPLILSGSALVLSLATVIMSALLLSRPAAGNLEQSTSEMKDAITAGSGSLAKKITALQDVCTDWQAALKTVADKPDATFMIVKTDDGMLTLREATAAAGGESGASEQKK